MANNTDNAFFERATRDRSLTHKRLTRPVLLLTGRADFNGVGPLLQPLARLSNLFEHCFKARRQGKRPQEIATNRGLRKNRHVKKKIASYREDCLLS